MKTKYYFVDNRTLAVKFIPLASEPDFFEAIETLTGLDEPMARAILDSGKPIEHPSYTFRRSAEFNKGDGTT